MLVALELLATDGYRHEQYDYERNRDNKAALYADLQTSKIFLTVLAWMQEKNKAHAKSLIFQ